MLYSIPQCTTKIRIVHMVPQGKHDAAIILQCYYSFEAGDADAYFPGACFRQDTGEISKSLKQESPEKP